MNIQDQLKAFEKTDKFKKLVAEKMKTDKSFVTSVGGKDYIKKVGDRMVEILHEKLEKIQSRSGESFLDSFFVKLKFETDKGWYVDISFDSDEMHRDSLYPQKYRDGVQINLIFNEGYKADNYVYGTDRHDNNLRSRLQRDGLFFIQEAVELFNVEQGGKAIAEYSSEYSGGTL